VARGRERDPGAGGRAALAPRGEGRGGHRGTQVGGSGEGLRDSHALPQPRLFALDALGEIGLLKALRLEGYAPRRPQGPTALRRALFPYAEAP
jgi:hypothetical protein